MLTASDLVSLPYTPDLTRAGITYACRSLAHTYDRMGGSPIDRLRRIVSGKAVELAFRRHLTTYGIPHDNLGATPFTDPDKYDVSLGGRRVDIKSFQIFGKKLISSIHKDPACLLDAAALVPADQLNTNHQSDNDLYIFTFLTALITPQYEDLQKAAFAGQPLYLIHPLPTPWALPSNWQPLQRLRLKSESGNQVLTLELGGQIADHSFATERLFLPSGKVSASKTGFHALAYLNISHLPEGRIGIRTASLEAHVIQPKEWGNIWIYGLHIYLAGYITRGEFRRRASYLPAGSQVFQYPHTRTPNYSLPIRDLYPLAELFKNVKAWWAGK